MLKVEWLVLLVFLSCGSMALALDESGYKNLIKQIDGLIERERYVEAIKLADQAIRLSPKDGQGFYKRGYAWMRRGEEEAALSDFCSAKKLGLKHCSLDKHIGECALRCSQYELAIKSLTAALKTGGDLKDIYMRRAEAYHEKGLEDLRLKDLNAALSIDGKDSYVLRERAKYFVDRGEYEKALVEYSSALKNTELDTTYEQRGDCNLHLSRLRDAIADYSKAIKLKPQKAGYYAKRAAVYRKLGEAQKALADEKRVEQLGEDFEIR